MQLENIVVDAVDPGRLGRFWEQALDTERLTDEPGIYETRLGLGDGAFLDLCFQRVARAPGESQRLHLDLGGGASQDEVVARLVGMGAQRVDIGQGDVPWTVLADPEGNPFCVVEDREAYRGTGPVAALPLDSADPDRDAAFWAWLTGWRPTPGVAPQTLRHPTGHGPLLELLPESGAKGDDRKNRMHLDVRLEPGESEAEVVAAILDLGGQEYDPDWGPLPWRLLRDPSGNEFCLLRAADSTP